MEPEPQLAELLVNSMQSPLAILESPPCGVMMGKQGGSVEQEEPQVSPDLKASLLTASMEWSMSWSTHWPHCITMWLSLGSGATLLLETTVLETRRGLGLLWPAYSRSGSEPIGVLNPFSYWGGRTRRRGLREAPQRGCWWLLQLPSADRNLAWKQKSEQSASRRRASHPEILPGEGQVRAELREFLRPE